MRYVVGAGSTFIAVDASSNTSAATKVLKRNSTILGPQGDRDMDIIATTMKHTEVTILWTGTKSMKPHL